VFGKDGLNVWEENWTIGEPWHHNLHHALGLQKPN
jgi:hypothetical protein